MTATCPLHPECTIGLLHHNCVRPHMGLFHRDDDIPQDSTLRPRCLARVYVMAKGFYKRCTRLGHHPSDREISALVPRRRALVERTEHTF